MQQDYIPKPKGCPYLANQKPNISPALKSRGYFLRNLRKGVDNIYHIGYNDNK